MRLPAVRSSLQLLLSDRLPGGLIISRITVDIAGHIRPGLKDRERAISALAVAAPKWPRTIGVCIVEICAGHQRRGNAVSISCGRSAVAVGSHRRRAQVAVVNRFCAT